MSESPYTPIEDYGLIGNLETCALVGPDGSVDWFPFPHVESPSILAAVLDDDSGGRFRIAPTGPFESSQAYIDRTNVLETTFQTEGGTATVTDFLPPGGEVDHPKKVIYRKVDCTDGTVSLDVEYQPQFGYGEAETTISKTDSHVHAAGGDERTVLESEIDLVVDDGRATAEVDLAAGETTWFLLRCTGAEDAAADPPAALRDTVEYWRGWVHNCEGTDGDCAFAGPWHDLVVRSALVLKLLTHAGTGAMVAAPTTSLPEEVGGVRNWDYRYNWIRDAGFTVQALLNLGHVEEASDYVGWFLELCAADDPERIQPLYGLHGDADLSERELDHLEGYRESRPVRVGNGAADQRQLDIYGELLLAVDEMHYRGESLAAEEWTAIRDFVEYVREVWDRRDAGIWEVRGGNAHFVHSKVLCWVALDRGIAIAESGDFDAPLAAWRDCRETIRTTVLDRGYDADLGSFTQSFEGTTVDATALLIPVVGFLSFDDDRVQGTIETVEDRLGMDEVLVKRYDGDDGLPGTEGAFVLCSCWLVNALALSGRLDEAVDRFETLIDYVSPLGLLAEELDPDTGAHLGNYPQAFSHVGLINSALYLGYAAGHEAPGPAPMGIRLGDPIGVDGR